MADFGNSGIPTVAQRMSKMGNAVQAGMNKGLISKNKGQGPRTQNNTFTGLGWKNGQQVQYNNGKALSINGASGSYTGYDQNGKYYQNGFESDLKPESAGPNGIQTKKSVKQWAPGDPNGMFSGIAPNGKQYYNGYMTVPGNEGIDHRAYTGKDRQGDEWVNGLPKGSQALENSNNKAVPRPLIAPSQKPFDPSTQYTSNPSSYSAGFKAPNDGVYRGNQGWKFTDLDHPPPPKPNNQTYNYTYDELVENGKWGQAYASKAGKEYMEKSKAQEAAYKANGGKYSMGMDGKMIMDLSNTSQPTIPKQIPLTKNGFEPGGIYNDGSLMGNAANTKPYSPGIPGYTIGYTPGGNVTSNWNGKEWVKTYD